MSLQTKKDFNLNEVSIKGPFKSPNGPKKSSIKMDHGLQCWLVVFSCSMINFILFGIYRSYALLFTALLDEFHITRTEASWPFSLCMTIIHLTGPISGLLTSKFTIRTIYAAGCCLSTLGIGLCYFASSITDISLYIGVIQGFGIGLTYVQSIAILSEYFSKKLGIANGIAQSLGPLGPFLISPLLSWALDTYKLKGSYIILTLLTMLTIPLTYNLKHNRPKINSKSSSYSNRLNFRSSKTYSLESRDSSLKSNLPNQVNSISLHSFKTVNELDTQQTKQDKQSNDERKKSISNSRQTNKDQLTKSTDLKTKNDENDEKNDKRGKINPLFIIDCDQTTNNQINKNKDDCQNTMEQKNSFASIVSRNFSNFKHSSVKRLNSIQINKRTLKFRASISSTNSMVSFTIANMLTVVSSVHFLLIMYTHLAYFWTIITYQMVIVDFSNDCGIARNLSNNMITAFSLGDLVGRLGSGYILDKRFCANKHYFLVCNLLVAILLNMLNFVKSYYGLLLITLLLGILAGMIVIVINICLCEYLGKKKAALAFGVSCFICGVATLARPNLVGYFRDILGSYKGLFNLLSVLCYFAFLLWVIEIIITRNKIRQKLLNADLPDRKI